MTTDREHDRHVDNLASCALGALPELERPVLERHLMGCERCRADLENLRAAADTLPHSLAPMAPSPEVKRALMATIHAEAAAAAPPRARRARRRPLLLRPAVAWAAAGVLAVAGFAIGSSVDDATDRQTLSARVDQDRLAGASGSLVLDEGGEQGAVLRMNGLPSVGSSRVYQLWIRRGSEVAPAGVFVPDADGSARAALPPLDDADLVMVTRERAGGARAPTQEPVVTVPVG